MTDEEKLLLRRKWKYESMRTFGNVMGRTPLLEVVDLSKEGVIILKDNSASFNYTLVDRTLEIVSPATAKNALRLRVGELTPVRLTLILSGKRGDEVDDKFNPEIMELSYSPMMDI